MTSQNSSNCDQDNQALVSIIMNCYNGEKYLREAIDSVLTQTYKNWEIIFWDNQSTDSSAEIFNSYLDPKLKYYYALKHTLLYEARNYALENARGEFIAFLDVDDWWFPEKLEQQIRLFGDPEVGAVCSNYLIENRNKCRRWLAFKNPMPQGRVLDDLLRYYFVGLLTLIVRRKALSSPITSFDPRYHIIGDYDLVIRLASTWRLCVVQSPLATYRIHEENESSKHRELRTIELETWHAEYAKHPVIGLSSNFHFVTYLILYGKAVENLLSGNRKDAANCMSKIPWGIPKLRLIVGLFLPVAIIKHLKN